MIKTDYKPKQKDKPIFSSSRKRSATPVITMSVIAFLLAVWGLWTEVTHDEEPAEQRIPLTIQPGAEIEEQQVKEEADEEPVSAPGSKRIELKLDFQHDEVTDPVINKPKDDEHANRLPSKSAESLVAEEEDFNWQQTKIRSGDSMAKLFSRQGLSQRDLHAIISIGKSTAILKNIKPGKLFEYSIDVDDQLQAIRYTIDRLNILTVTREDEEWSASLETKEVEIRHANARGTIKSSLFLAGKEAGLTDAMVMELAGIFGWDIDFILDIREDDQFTAIYEEKYVDGEKIGNGNILAAEFVNQGNSYKAVRYEDSSGHAEYYTPEGLSMRKAFLRAPLDFSYVSSKFNPKRFHPILRKVKAHNGVDYRAPKGTPVKAAGDGKVITSAYSKYNGHHVFIQHGQKYVTKYLHFTKRKVRRGQRVKQGQIIGYVGATGLAEAPHLHYEFLVNGVHRNPRTIKLPDADPINGKEKQQFLAQTSGLVEQLRIQSQIFDDTQLSAAE